MKEIIRVLNIYREGDYTIPSIYSIPKGSKDIRVCKDQIFEYGGLRFHVKDTDPNQQITQVDPMTKKT